MATMFGRFEVQSELSKSDTALIYKAMDTETNQVVALKTQSLESLGERSDAFVETLIAEGERTRELVSQNIVMLYGAGEIDGQFCASMEYIQGNSIATMLARKEGFSIWDLLDITRQLCAGLEHAASIGVAHSSLEPAKIMVQWDGMVKILGYGISNMSLIEAESGKGLGRLMPYCSPEQIRGEAIDLRSNLFTVGAILYEMVVSRKAFDAQDDVALVNQIQNETPANPSSVNAKIQPAVSALIMKALAKDPAERYQNARELLADLELCKENKKAATETKRPVAAAVKVAVDPAARAAAASKFVSPGSSVAKSEAVAVPAVPKPAVPKPVAPRVASAPVASPASTSSTLPELSTFEPKASAAAAGAAHATTGRGFANPILESESDATSGARMIEEIEQSVRESQAAHAPVLSAEAVEKELEPEAAPASGDPMMTGALSTETMSAATAAARAKFGATLVEAQPASTGTSFSDLAEMPPLKEPVYTPPAPEPVEQTSTVTQIYPRQGKDRDQDEKPRIQPREVAAKAVKEISTIPPRLMLFAILGAVGLILVIAIAVFFHVRSADDDATAAPRPTKVVTPAPAQPVAQAPLAQAVVPQDVPVMDTKPNLSVRQIERQAKNARRSPVVAATPVVVSGEALIDSTPQGASFQLDGKSDPSWVTPFSLAALTPGKHIVSVSKSGYTSETRSVDVAAASKSSLVIHLAPVNALVVVNSTPVGAEIVLDGKPTGRITPAQFAVEKGSHTVLVKKQGFLEETITADLGPAQNFQFAPALRALGNAEDIKTVGKFNKLFGHGSDSTAGMGSISIHTQPKGAQVAINQRILDKISPVDVMLGPGNYIVDVTMTGFKPIHKIVNVEKGGKVAIDEVLERQ